MVFTIWVASYNAVRYPQVSLLRSPPSPFRCFSAWTSHPFFTELSSVYFSRFNFYNYYNKKFYFCQIMRVTFVFIYYTDCKWLSHISSLGDAGGSLRAESILCVSGARRRLVTRVRFELNIFTLKGWGPDLLVDRAIFNILCFCVCFFFWMSLCPSLARLPSHDCATSKSLEAHRQTFFYHFYSSPSLTFYKYYIIFFKKCQWEFFS